MKQFDESMLLQSNWLGQPGARSQQLQAPTMRLKGQEKSYAEQGWGQMLHRASACAFAAAKP